MIRTLLATAITYTLICASGSTLAATAYVSNEKDDSISVIDLETLETVETFEVGQRPRARQCSAVGDRCRPRRAAFGQ
jgi:YVTN family beta-propeller protein